VAKEQLFTRPFVAVLLIAFLGFAQNFILQPILPLLITGIGGDAAVVGIAFAMFSIPSIVLRPQIGRFADRFGSQRVLLLGTLGIALMAPVYVVPSIAVVLAARVVHGVAWAAFSTGATSIMARIAPAGRRMQASGVYDLMPALDSLVMASVGLILLQTYGFAAPFLLAGAFAAIAAIITATVFRPAAGWWSAASPLAATPAVRRRFLEPVAVLPMIVLLLFTSASSLFLVYPPLLAPERGIPLSDLTIYYPAYGLVLVLVRLASSRLLTGVAPSRAIAAGGVLAVAALLLAAVAHSLLVLTGSAMLFALGYGFTTPAAQASVMERSPSDRLGSAMATYTIGFQAGIGLGAAFWGILIGPAGYAGTFLIGAAIQVALIGLTVFRRAALDGHAPLEPA
jgi:predicted MFS family arabinose efflux permease